MLAASEFIKLKVEEPYLTMKINMAAVERGQQGEMVCDLDITRPFDGLAKAELKGLPLSPSLNRWSLMQIPLKFVFQLTLKTKHACRSHQKSFLLCAGALLRSLVTHTVGQGGQIRLDNPPPKPKAVTAKPKPSTPQPVVKKEKPLSRLEQLRLVAQSGTN